MTAPAPQPGGPGRLKLVEPQGDAPRLRLVDPVPPPLATRSELGKAAKWIIGGTLGVMLLWGLSAPLHKGATAGGKLETSDSRAVVRSLAGGVARTVLVKPGETVRRGALLAQMDVDADSVALKQLFATRDRLSVDRAIYQAEVRGDAILNLPAGFATGDVALASYVSVQRAGLGARLNSRQSQKAALVDQRRRQQLEAQGLRERLASQGRQMASLNEETGDIRSLYNRGFAPKQRVLGMERQAEELRASQAQTSAALQQAGASMSELDQEAVRVEAEAVQLAAQRLAETEAMMSETLDKIAAQQIAVQRGEIRAPIDGVVLTRAAGPGTVIRPGDSLFELVPNSNLIVRAMIKPGDVEHVRVGEDVRVKFSGLNVQTTPNVHGKVIYVSADTMIDERTRADYFEVKVEVPRSERAKLKGVTLTAGMPAEVMIDAGARSALAYMVQPIVNAYNRSFRE